VLVNTVIKDVHPDTLEKAEKAIPKIKTEKIPQYTKARSRRGLPQRRSTRSPTTVAGLPNKRFAEQGCSSTSLPAQ
jgi:hypothetical protein